MRRFLFLMLLPFLVWAKTPLLAVAELSPRGVSEADAAIITDRLRSELLQTRKVRVMERANMDKILKEQAFQQSGACEASECAAEIGKILSVDRMVVGSVGKIGELYTLSVRLLDVSTGEVLFSVNEDNERGRLESVLTRSVPHLADKVIEGILYQNDENSDMGTGDVYVTVEDSSATLTLDGKPVSGRMLFALEKIDAGQHTLVARTAMMVGSIDIVLGRNEVLRVDIPLKPATGTVKFLSDPMGAQIFVNRQLIGQTPFKSSTLQVGEIKATFHKLGFFDTTVTFALGQDQEIVSKLTLTPVGNLAFDPETPAEMTLIQGRDTLVRSGDKPIGLRPGSWRLQVRDKAWQSMDTVVQIKKGRTSTVPLRRQQARVSIIASPEADAWLDGVALGPTPHILDTVAPGTHTLILRQQGYKDAVRKISVTPGQVVLKRITLENRNGPTPEELESRARDE